MAAEYKVDTDSLQTQIAALTTLLGEFPKETFSPITSDADKGSTHDGICEIYTTLQQTQQQLISLIEFTRDYFQKYLDAVLGNDKTVIVTNSGQMANIITINENYDIPSNRSKDATPRITNTTGYRSTYAYESVINGFDVEHTRRYQNDGSTWCNLFVADVTAAMGDPIPHYYNPATGEPLPKGTAGGNWLNADGMMNWLDTYGSQNGWVECTREQAIEMANNGMPTVAGGHQHIAMVAPQHEGDSGVMLAQAGATISSHVSINKCWTASDQQTLKYYYHS